MLSLQQIESDMIAAMKAKNQLVVDTLRGLKVRIQNEKIARTRADLSEEEIISLVQSEVKRRKEAAQAFLGGGRQEQAGKELAEAEILQKYLPAQMPEAKLSALIDKTISENGFTSKDFGKAMGRLKATVGQQADGAALAKLLREKLK